MFSTMRNAVVRISEINNIKIKNEKLSLKPGDTLQYCKEDILETLETWDKNYDFYMIEHNEDEDNIHWHIVLEFKFPTAFNQIKNKFPYGDIEKCKYGVKKAVQYLTHMNNPEKYQYSWDEVYTNAPAKLEIYKIPKAVKDTNKLRELTDKIVSGEIREYETEKIDPQLYIKYKAKIKNAFEYRQLIIAKNPNRSLQVIVCQGPPRVGKSLFAKIYAEKNNMSICFSSSSNDPWQEYMGQDIFVYDDFNYTNIHIEDLLKAFDPHNLTSVSARYKNRLFVGNIIFVCTNRNITEWYTWACNDHRKALFARISCVLDFTGINDGVSTYYANRIVDSGRTDYTVNSRNLVENTYSKMILQPVDDKVREFNLNKYVDINADDIKTDDFINFLSEF